MAHDGRRKRWLMFGAAVLPAVMVIAGLWMAGTKGRKYETVTVCMPAYRNVDDLTMVQDAVNKITEERYGISFEFHMISSANYLKSMEIALLDPSLDIMLINGKPLFQHVEDQQLVDLTDYMGRASEEMRGLWTDEILRGVSVGGRLYGLPTFRNFGNYIGLNLDEEIAAEFGVRDRQKMTMEEVDVLLHEIKRRYPDRNVLVPIQYNKDKSENPCKIKGFRDLSLFFFRLFFIKIRLCKVGRKGQCYINDKITATGNGGMNGKQKLDCLQRNHRCL